MLAVLNVYLPELCRCGNRCGRTYCAGLHMWQSRVENEHYSVACFECVTMFKALQCSSSVKGGAHMHCVNS